MTDNSTGQAVPKEGASLPRALAGAAKLVARGYDPNRIYVNPTTGDVVGISAPLDRDRTPHAQALRDVKAAQKLLIGVKDQLGNDNPAYNLLTVAINDAYEVERFLQGWWP